MSNRKNVYFTDKTLRQIPTRESLSGFVAKVIDRYTELCRRERPSATFSNAELAILKEACADWPTEPAALIPGTLGDHLRSTLDPTAHHDLIVKAAFLSAGGEIGLADWLESHQHRTPASVRAAAQ